MGSTLSSQLFMSIPLWMRLYEYVTQDNPGPISNLALLSNHSAYVLILVLTAFFFTSFLPERASPGGYDIFGHSHQIFHCLIILMSLWQLRAGYTDFTSQPEHVLSQLKPCFISTFGSCIITLLSGILFIFLMRNRLKEVIAKLCSD